MVANLITIGRIALAFVVLILFQYSFWYRIAAIVLIGAVIYLDALDGIVARRRGETSEFGAMFDITGDRIVEHVFWVLFATLGLISMWVPIIFITRSFVVDTVRTMSLRQKSVLPFAVTRSSAGNLTYALAASRFSRAFYGVAKVVVFVLLGVGALTLTDWRIGEYAAWFSGLDVMTAVLVWVVVALSLIRAIPSLIDGWNLMRAGSDTNYSDQKSVVELNSGVRGE